MSDQDILQQEAQGILGSVPGFSDMKDVLKKTIRRRRTVKHAWTDLGLLTDVGDSGFYTADSACKVISATVTLGIVVTGGDTNYNELRVSKHPAATPASPVIVATSYTTATTPTPVLGTTVAFTPAALTLSATAANTLLASGDVLSFAKLHTAAGLACCAAITATGAYALVEVVLEDL